MFFEPFGTLANWHFVYSSHIITNTVIENCGYRSPMYDRYDTSPTRGCGNESDTSKGCSATSSVFEFVTHSDEFVPEVMQATKNLTYIDCGRRFKNSMDLKDSVSGRNQNWLDIDGSASNLGEPTLMGSGLDSVKDWWRVSDEDIFDEQGPVRFIHKNGGPNRAVGHVHFSWDKALHAKTGIEYCLNGDPGPCPIEGYMRHLGHKFSPTHSNVSKGMPVASNPDTVGPIGGFGWVFALDGGAPRDLNMSMIEVAPGDTMMLSIAYPIGTGFTVYANAESWCRPKSTVSCRQYLTAASSKDEIRRGNGTSYYVDSNGVLTIKLLEFDRARTGNPNWLGIPSYNTMASDGVNYAVPRFERDGVILPNFNGVYFRIQADCAGSGVFCNGTVVNYDPDVCASGYKQVAYDKCCRTSAPTQCTFADGSTTS